MHSMHPTTLGYCSFVIAADYSYVIRMCTWVPGVGPGFHTLFAAGSLNLILIPPLALASQFKCCKL